MESENSVFNLNLYRILQLGFLLFPIHMTLITIASQHYIQDQFLLFYLLGRGAILPNLDGLEGLLECSSTASEPQIDIEYLKPDDILLSMFFFVFFSFIAKTNCCCYEYFSKVFFYFPVLLC